MPYIIIDVLETLVLPVGDANVVKEKSNNTAANI